MSNLTKRIVVSSSIFIILMALFLLAINLEYNRVIDHEREELENYVELLKSDVDKLLKQRIINLRGFIPHIQLNPDLTQDEFSAFASRLLSSDDIVIKDVTFATDTTITHVYPLEGNEAIMGVDLTTLEGQREVVLMVKEKGEIVIDGPFEIVEGGVGIICRIPVFLDSKREPSTYLGQLNYVVNFDVFLEETGLQDAIDSHNIRITQVTGIDDSKKTMLSNVDKFTEDAVVSKLFLPNVEWEITIEEKEGFKGRSNVFYLLCFLAIFIIILTIIYTNIILKSKYALEKSLKELKESQRKLVMSEKLAAIGSLTAGVAHELNTPLGNSITVASYVEEATKGLFHKYKNKKLTKNDMEQFLDESQESYGLIIKSLDRMVTLIEKFKLLTSSENSVALGRIELKNFIEESLDYLKNKEPKEIIVYYCLEDIIIYSDSRAITNIIENLFENSVAHGFLNTDKGKVNIKAYRNQLSKDIVIEYWDDGPGVPDEIRDEVFTPFYSTQKDKGHAGLGLHIIYNAVVNVLRGHVELRKNESGKDVFLISFPEGGK